MAHNLNTIGGRIASLREARKIKSAGELARLVNATGYEVSRQAVGMLERGGVDTPRMGLIEALADVLDTTPEYLLYGPRIGEDGFVVELSGLAPDLEQAQRDQLLWLANDMARETRARREEAMKLSAAGLSEDEAELLRLYRGSSTLGRSAAIGALRGGSDQTRP